MTKNRTCCNKKMYQTRTLDTDKHVRHWWICEKCKRQISRLDRHRLFRKEVHEEGLQITREIMEVPPSDIANLTNLSKGVSALLQGKTGE